MHGLMDHPMGIRIGSDRRNSAHGIEYFLHTRLYFHIFLALCLGTQRGVYAMISLRYHFHFVFIGGGKCDNKFSSFEFTFLYVYTILTM